MGHILMFLHQYTAYTMHIIMFSPVSSDVLHYTRSKAATTEKSACTCRCSSVLLLYCCCSAYGGTFVYHTDSQIVARLDKFSASLQPFIFFHPLFELRVQPILSLTSVLSNGHKSRSLFWYNIRSCPHHFFLITTFVLEFCVWTFRTYVLTSALQYMKLLVAGFSQRRPEFNLIVTSFGICSRQCALEQISLHQLSFPQSTMLICHQVLVAINPF